MYIKQESYPFAVLFENIREDIEYADNYFTRVKRYCINNKNFELIDMHSQYDINIHYTCVSAITDTIMIDFNISGIVKNIIVKNNFGFLFRINNSKDNFTVWLPFAVGIYDFDKDQRINTNCKSSFSLKFNIHPKFQLIISKNKGTAATLSFPYVVMKDPDGQFLDDLLSLNDTETRLYRKTDWFFAKTPSDVWNYLINGSIYDPRHEKGVDKRFKCQQCAYAWCNYFGFLYGETNKKVYDMIQDEIAYAVLLDMSGDGKWGHGYWSDTIETHARFHLDGLHLLISQYHKTGDHIWLKAAERGMTFISKNLTEQLDDDSLWFLHDTIENEQKHRFKSTIFGKSPGNSLCINTHIQALTVLHRLRIAIPQENKYAEMFEKGAKALRRVLDHQPGEIFYRILMSSLINYKTGNKARSICGKIKNRLESRIIPKAFWYIRQRFPRIVYPGGFIERDISLGFFSDTYQIINLKDLLTLYQQNPFNWIRPYIKKGFEFTRIFLQKLDLINALERSPYYIELIDIIYLYNKLIASVPPEEIDCVENIIHQKTNGYSLDYYASELVRGRYH